MWHPNYFRTTSNGLVSLIVMVLYIFFTSAEKFTRDDDKIQALFRHQNFGKFEKIWSNWTGLLFIVILRKICVPFVIPNQLFYSGDVVHVQKQRSRIAVVSYVNLNRQCMHYSSGWPVKHRASVYVYMTCVIWHCTEHSQTLTLGHLIRDFW